MAAIPRPVMRGPRLRLHLRLSRTNQFSTDYWTFFLAAFCMDLGFGLFVFLFNLYLTDLHFDERFIGNVLACFTFGNVAGTIPAMIAARRFGLRPLLLLAFGVVPGLSILRLFFLSIPAQLILAFLTGATLCGWPICFSPAVAQLTNEKNRASGFSIAFATGIGLGTVAGIAGGYIPQLLRTSPLHLSIVGGIRVVLVISCAIVALGLGPMSRLSLKQSIPSPDARPRIFHPYLLRFLPAFLLWNVVTGSFPLFGAVYLQKVLGLPLGRLGGVFAASQLVQFIAVLGSPLLFRRTGIGGGISLAQLATAVLLVSLAGMRFMPAAICLYVLYFAAQFLCGPGIYQLLMEQIPEAERSSASAIQNLSGALCQAGTAAITGTCIVVYGYRTLLIGNAGVAVVASLLFAWMGLHAQRSDAGHAACGETTGPSRMAPDEADWVVEKAGR
jgi:MFS family permease